MSTKLAHSSFDYWGIEVLMDFPKPFHEANFFILCIFGGSKSALYICFAPINKKILWTNPVGKSSYIIIMTELDFNLPFMENAGEQLVRTCIKTFWGDFWGCFEESFEKKST